MAKSIERFAKILVQQLARVEKVRQDTGRIDFPKMQPIIVGILGGDGIRPAMLPSLNNF